MTKHFYPAGGWLPENAHYELMWDDQGRDFATGWGAPIQAPGAGFCVDVHADAAFPSGFGPHYPQVRIETGPWKGHDYYIGHTSTRVSPGERFPFGHVLSVADQGHDWAGTHGGWCELGEWFSWGPGPKLSSHWYDALIARPLVIDIPDPPLWIGNKGWRVIGLTANLHACGWFKPPYRWTFDREVHGAVVAFKKFHKIPLIPPDGGLVDATTDAAIKHAADWCKKHGPEAR